MNLFTLLILSALEALAKPYRRYFASHGPTTLQDFVWWSGLAATDTRSGSEIVGTQLMHEEIDGQMYWFSPSTPFQKVSSPTAYLLPNYDEYIVGYTDRSAIYDAIHNEKLDSRSNVLFNHTIAMNGRIAGTWKRTLKKDALFITP